MVAPFRIAFVCTGNACRSQMAEAIMRQVGGPRFVVASGGTDPAGFIHPAAAQAMNVLHFPMEGQYSKSWEDLATAPQDMVITLCDYAAGQVHPAWQGEPVIAHWGLPDPSFHPGDDNDRLAVAQAVARVLHRRLEQLAALPLERMSAAAVLADLERLGQIW